MQAVGQLALLAVDGPVAGLEALTDEILRTARDIAAIEAEGPAQVPHDHPAGGELLVGGEPADRIDVLRTHHVVGRLHVHEGLVVETFEVRARLGEEHEVDALVGATLSLLDRGVDRLAGRLVVDYGTLDHPVRLALAKTDEIEGGAGVFSDENGGLGRADLDGTNKTGGGFHEDEDTKLIVVFELEDGGA